jgi:hypothetical protein
MNRTIALDTNPPDHCPPILLDAEVEGHDLTFWMQLPEAKRLLSAWRLGEDLWRLRASFPMDRDFVDLLRAFVAADLGFLLSRRIRWRYERARTIGSGSLAGRDLENAARGDARARAAGPYRHPDGADRVNVRG